MTRKIDFKFAILVINIKGKLFKRYNPEIRYKHSGMIVTPPAPFKKIDQVMKWFDDTARVFYE